MAFALKWNVSKWDRIQYRYSASFIQEILGNALWRMPHMNFREYFFYLYYYSLIYQSLKCHCDEISHFFFPLLFTQNNLPSCTMSFRPERKKLKRFPSLKFRRSKSEILRPLLVESGSGWARYFHSGSYTCDVIYLTRDWWSLDFRGILVGFWLKYLRNACRFRSSIWGKFVSKQYYYYYY